VRYAAWEVKRPKLDSFPASGDLLKECDARGNHMKKEGALLSQEQAAEAAHISEHHRKQAVRVANVPAAEFEAAIEGHNPALGERRGCEISNFTAATYPICCSDRGNATRKNANSNTMGMCRRAFPPSSYAPQRTPAPKGGPHEVPRRVSSGIVCRGLSAGIAPRIDRRRAPRTCAMCASSSSRHHRPAVAHHPAI
jgi:hypothetical protein